VYSISRYGIWLIALLLLFSVFAVFFSWGGNVVGEVPTVLKAESGVIRIDSNQDFADQASLNGWSGDGSAGDPYIIENLEIDAQI
jgi:hypothetical protein